MKLTKSNFDRNYSYNFVNKLTLYISKHNSVEVNINFINFLKYSNIDKSVLATK